MRLINTQTLQLEEHSDSELSESAILSHRWREEEIDFDDIRSLSKASSKKAFTKLQTFCSLAQSLGCTYAWIDTCCINKNSSAELEGALNSMYWWYAHARVCIAYLDDVGPANGSLEDSEWFERGWTLQELIAPQHISFYDAGWQPIGTKFQLLRQLSNITGIPEDVLSHQAGPKSCSVAQRMSWASRRKTQRIEDMAYSLIGLFEVSIEMKYGEREKAFIRLQESIIQYSADQSIFAWSLDPLNHASGSAGLLAPSPASFAQCGDIIMTSEHQEFAIRNIGLSIELPTFPYSMETYAAILECTRHRHPYARCAILLSKVQDTGQYARVFDPEGISMVIVDRPKDLPLVTTTPLHVRQTPSKPPLNIVYGFQLGNMTPPGCNDRTRYVFSRAHTSRSDSVVLRTGQIGTAGIVFFEPSLGSDGLWSQIRLLKLGFDRHYNPHIILANDKAGRYQFKPPRRDAVLSDLELIVTENHASATYRDLLSNDWIDTPATAEAPTKTGGWPSGRHHLIVDKHVGYEGVIEGINLGIRVKLQPVPASGAKTTGGMPQPNLIWTIDLEDLGGTSPEVERAGVVRRERKERERMKYQRQIRHQKAKEQKATSKINKRCFLKAFVHFGFARV